jgi:hypothetical protein
MKNPPKCVGGNLCFISCQYFNQSIVGAPAQYNSQFTLFRIICLVFYNTLYMPATIYFVQDINLHWGKNWH